MRTIVLHYHLFKNAGTSVDAILRENFPGAWIGAEFEGHDNAIAVGRWIDENPAMIAFSSHTARLPLPPVKARVLPIVFVRHPLDRIMSVYRFEQRQEADTLGVRLARAGQLADYIRARLNLVNDRQCRNFHTDRLAPLVPGPDEAETERAIAALDRLPFVGVVEDFDASMVRLNDMLQPHFPDFRARARQLNVTQPSGVALGERLQQMRAAIGGALFEELEAINKDDLALYDAACRKTGEC